MAKKKKKIPGSPLELKFTGKVSVLIDTDQGPMQFHANDVELVHDLLDVLINVGALDSVDAYGKKDRKIYDKILEDIA